MPQNIIISPDIESDCAALLIGHADQLNKILDNPDPSPKPIAQGILENIGTLLWEASGLDEKNLLKAIDKARDDEEPVRLIITGEEFYHLPWELLWHGNPELGFLARHSWCVVTRRTRGDGDKKPTAAASPLRILLFISSPENLDPERFRLDFEKEEELLFTAIDAPMSRGDIDVDVAEDGCFSTLVSRLESNRYHAVILSMHGTPKNKTENEWALLFEDEKTGKGVRVAGDVLADMFDQLPKGRRPGFVVLAACRSAKPEETADSITDISKKLHEKGVERVLGMRLSVMDRAASAFNAELFRRVALGQYVSRAVNLARDSVAKGRWRESGDDAGDLYGQWSLPVLLDRTADGPLIDTELEGTPIERPPIPTIIGGSIPIPSREMFIGRRAETRAYLRSFLDAKTRCLMFTGIGGVGKTTLAGRFVLYLMERQPGIRVMGFTAPFDFDRIYEPIRQAAFDGEEEPALINIINTEPDTRERIRRMLVSLAKRKERPCCFVLDNLETIQDIKTLGVCPGQEDSLWFVQTVCNLPLPARVLMTGRYAVEDLARDIVVQCRVRGALYGDILNRMSRLEWPGNMDAEKKRWIYTVLGGNHRAVEWMACLLKNSDEKADELVQALENTKAPHDTPEAAADVVVEAMRQNMLFSVLRDQLTGEQDRLLRAVSLYRVPVNKTGLVAVEADMEKHGASRKRLLDYSLLEKAYDPELETDYFFTPPVVRELLGDRGFGAEELKGLHGAMARYHRFQGEHFSRIWEDYLEAIYHFRKAGEHVVADELARGVCNFYWRTSNFTDAKKLAGEIVERSDPSPPWWALNRYAQCQQVFGFLDEALDVLKQALTVVPNKEDEGTTLNNIGEIHRNRGDYETALKYLEQSLQIIREIGDKSGEGTTLNNMSVIAHTRGDYETALKYLEQSLQIIREIGDKSGEGTTLNNISQI
ncbi:MAG: tetratricopeptide repeat protein, partial [Desulfobacterales bacterium]|nr:tetratricopeptide repeat protein [Desulfobacterales bacterium]